MILHITDEYKPLRCKRFVTMQDLMSLVDKVTSATSRKDLRRRLNSKNNTLLQIDVHYESDIIYFQQKEAERPFAHVKTKL